MILKFIGNDAGFGDKNNSAYVENENKLFIIDCGFTVFNEIKNKFAWEKYCEINIIITHLHNDHAGSLGQLILYLWYVHHKKVNVISKCKNIKKYLEISGTEKKGYIIKRELENLKFIETQHVSNLDCYGFYFNIDKKNIVYTGDTAIIEPFEKYLKNADEFYVDISKNSDVHLKIDDVFEKFENIQNAGTRVYLMHIDDKEYIKQKIRNSKIKLVD